MLWWKSLYNYLFKSLLSILLGIDQEMELLDDMVILFLNFWGTIILFPQQLHHFTILPTVHKGSDFSISSPILVIFCYCWGFFHSGHPNWCELVSYCGSDLHFPNDYWCDVEHFFMCCQPFVYLLWKNIYSSPLSIF